MRCSFTVHLIQSNNRQPVERVDSTLPPKLYTSSADTSSLAPDQMVVQNNFFVGNTGLN